MSSQGHDTGAIHVSYTLSPREIARGTRAMLIHSPVAWAVTAGLAAFSLLRLLSDPPDASPLVYLFFVLLVFLVVVPAATAFLSRRQIEPVEMVFDDSGILLNTATAQSHLDWRFFTSARELGEVYALRKGWQQTVMVPKRAFEDPASEASFRALCATHSKAHF